MRWRTQMPPTHRDYKIYDSEEYAMAYAIVRYAMTLATDDDVSSRVDLDKKAACCQERRFRQVGAKQPRLDVRTLVEEVARLILRQQEDGRLRWYEDGRVRVLVGKVLPD